MNAAQILEAFPRYSALVIGDICLDRWCTYDPAATEPSRETGIPRIGVVSTEITPGAGGTVANNLAALGVGRVGVLGVIGDDGFGVELTRALSTRNITTDLLVRAEDVPTFTYTKLINARTGEEDQPRVDYLHTRDLPKSAEARVLEYLRLSFDAFDVVLVSDQSETATGGVITAPVRELLAELAKTNPGKLIWVDSRIRGHLFRSVTLKQNEREARESSQVALGTVDYRKLRRHVEAPTMFVTLGERGALVIDDRGETLVPVPRDVRPVDICGAGDSFTAGAALALAITNDPLLAARFGNAVASVTVGKRGTGTASPAEVIAAWDEG